MTCFSVQTRIRYGETDRMGYVYHGNYPVFYDMARTEFLRSLGISYKELEDLGVLMPVIDLKIKYKAPVFYDELITIHVSVNEMPTTRMHFFYDVYNEKNQLVNQGETVLVFIDAKSRKPIRLPKILVKPFEALKNKL